MQKNDLALGEYIALDNDKVRTKAGWKMLISFTVLLAIYIFPNLPKILKLVGIVARSARVCIAVGVIIILAALIWHFCCTTKVLQRRMHFSKAQKIWSWILLIMVLPTLIITITVFQLPIRKVIIAFLTAASAGLIEELLFRGLLFNSLLVFLYRQKYRFLIASLISAALFGLMHALNIVEQPVKSTIGQIIFAFGIGLAFVYVRLLTNGIVWSILLHFWIDFKPIIITSDTGTHNTPIGLVFVGAIPLIVLAVICIWLFNRQYLKLNE